MQKTLRNNQFKNIFKFKNIKVYDVCDEFSRTWVFETSVNVGKNRSMVVIQPCEGEALTLYSVLLLKSNTKNCHNLTKFDIYYLLFVSALP